MSRKDRFRPVHFFIMLVVMLSSFAPGCKLFSGEYSVMELCNAYGIINVSVQIDKDKSDQSNETASQTMPCTFCTVHSLSSTILTAELSLVTAPIKESYEQGYQVILSHLRHRAGFLSRGPPLLNV